MSGPWGGLFAVAVFVLAGWGLSGISRALRGLGWARRLGYAYVLGLATVPALLYAGSHVFGLPLRGRTALFTALACAGLGGLWQWRVAALRPGTGRSAAAGTAVRRGSPPGGPPRSRRVGRWVLPGAVVLVAGWVTLGLFAAALTEPEHDFDGRMTWSSIARYVRHDASVDPDVLFRSQWFVSHPRYPILMPVAQVAAEQLARADDDRFAFRPLYAALFPALLLVGYDAAVRAAGRRAALWATLLLALLPVLWDSEGGANSAYSDLPLALFVGAGAILLLRRQLDLGSGLCAGLLLGAAVLTKNEGAALAAIGLLLGAWAVGERRGQDRWRAWGLAALLVLLAMGLLVHWRWNIPERHDEGYGTLLAQGGVLAGVPRALTEVLPVAAERMWTSGAWAGLWWLAIPVCALGARGLRGRRNLRLLLLALAPLAIAAGAYVVHPQPGVLARVTWDRFLLQGAVSGLALGAVALRWGLRRFRSVRQPGLARQAYRA